MKKATLLTCALALLFFTTSARALTPLATPPFEPGKRLGPFSLFETRDEIGRRGVTLERRAVDGPGVMRSGPYWLKFDDQQKLVEIRVPLEKVPTGFFFDGKRIDPKAKRFEIVARLKNCQEDGPTIGAHTVRCQGANVMLAGPTGILYLIVVPAAP